MLERRPRNRGRAISARAGLGALLLVLAPLMVTTPAPSYAQPPPPVVQPGPDSNAGLPAQTVSAPDESTQFAQLLETALRLPIAAGLACALALRPRRRGTPHRQPHVVQTQIILAIVGALVMLVVGTSLARAFGIVGAAGLVRYRARIDDPKDAGVMLCTLAVGLAAGVGLWMLATFAAAFILALLWVIESVEPKALQLFLLKVKAKDPAALKPKLDELFRRNRLEFELRTSTPEEVCYEVKLPFDKKTDKLSNAILELAPENAAGVEWEEKKAKKSQV